MCENKTIVVKTNNMCKKFIMIYMLKQLIDVKININNPTFSTSSSTIHITNATKLNTSFPLVKIRIVLS